MTSPTTKKMKTSDRQTVVRKVTAVLKKKYGRAVPKDNRPVLESLLYAICLENTSQQAAEEALEKLLGSFHDLNEIRVSSITEIEAILVNLPAPEWKALRIREALQFTFEKYYSFDLDVLKRKTMDVAEKQLSKIAYITPFVQSYVVQNCLASHAVPVDDVSREVLQWMGLVAQDADNIAASEEMKSVLRKPDAQLFGALIREVATDRKYAGTFTAADAETDGEVDPGTAAERLKQHLARPPKAVKKSVKKSRRKPPSAHRTAKKSKSASGSVRKRVSKPKKGAKRRVASK
jgi:endonuclease III